jgi:hypothetical protein
VIHDRKNPRRIERLLARLAHRIERRSPGAFVQEDAIDCDQRTASANIDDDMGIPDFIEEGPVMAQITPPANASRA